MPEFVVWLKTGLICPKKSLPIYDVSDIPPSNGENYKIIFLARSCEFQTGQESLKYS